MYKIIPFLLVLPLFSNAQERDKQDIYLNQKNEITIVKTDLKCIRNEELSSGYTVCYNCIDGAKKVRKQLNMELFFKSELKTPDNTIFIKNDSIANGDYLIGDYLDGKPFNGFFKSMENDWLIYDYYQEGKLIQQLYNDKFHTIQQEQDTKLAYTTLDAINTFKDGILMSGIKIKPVEIKHGAGEIITVVKDAKTTAFMIALYAENFGECVRIIRVDDGLFFKSLWNNAMKITFTTEGRKVEMFNREGQIVNTLNYRHYKLLDEAKVDQKRFYVYICKNKEIYIEQINDEKQLLVEEERSKKENESSLIRNLGNNFFSPVQLNPIILERLINDHYWGMGTFFGRHDFYEGKASGLVYHKGDTEGTYNADFIGEDNNEETRLKIRNKTPDQIIEILKNL
ncbi:hypothetical protein [Pedobacter sp. MR2016-24]|uniref:hypothetical protein n=1 Tax=Pedobacter sp. MR2016-24 TaxID=2994466 RepID=UPI002247F522|nr:hypothetical protein [Pedobacter sp. MR2016-24]MCX2486415.1 hypothetical protein [Pedobacter sp. MR2016-24]